VPTFANRGCRVNSVTDPYGHILGFLDRSRYCFFQVAPQLYSWGWVDPVPDSLFLRKSGSAGNRTRTSGSVDRNSDHYNTDAVLQIPYNWKYFRGIDESDRMFHLYWDSNEVLPEFKPKKLFFWKVSINIQRNDLEISQFIYGLQCATKYIVHTKFTFSLQSTKKAMKYTDVNSRNTHLACAWVCICKELLSEGLITKLSPSTDVTNKI
jgi:hypothetical protein